MNHPSRRQFLASTAAAGMLGAVPSLLISGRPALAMPATAIRAGTRVVEVNGRPATVFGLTQPDGSHGLITGAGKSFQVRLENQLDDETLIHWHGLTPPWRQDGVPNLSQAPLKPGAARDYDFTLERPGTNWMHSHHGLQEQRLMAAPLIVRDPGEAGADMQDVVVLFHDFTFRDPSEILAELQGNALQTGGVDHAAMGHGDMAMAQRPAPAGCRLRRFSRQRSHPGRPGSVPAFIVALFAEMYGFPLTLYLLAGWVGSNFPALDPLSHDAGHLWPALFGWSKNPHWSPFHLLSFVFIGGGFMLIAAAWRVLHDAQREGKLATTGPYARLRHPQYVGFVLIMIGFFLQWPTMVTGLMLPVLLVMYWRLAKSEEREVEAAFGDQYRRYARAVPAFLPRPASLLRSSGR